LAPKLATLTVVLPHGEPFDRLEAEAAQSGAPRRPASTEYSWRSMLAVLLMIAILAVVLIVIGL
jgi:hypothetical protein